MLGPQDTLFFLHVPKTAGSTFSAILASHFRPDEIYPTPTPPEVQEVAMKSNPGRAFLVTDSLFEAHRLFDAAEIGRYRLLTGHWDYGIRRHAPSLVPITMLRDPVERLISDYKFLLRTRDRWTATIHERLHAEGSGLKVFSSPDLKAAYANWQTRQIAGYLWSAPESAPDGRELIEMAKRNLDEFALVGLAERFHESVLLLCYLLAWKPVTEYPSLNVAPDRVGRESLSPTELEILTEMSELDLELYEHAKRLYNKALSSMLRRLIVDSDAMRRQSPAPEDAAPQEAEIARHSGEAAPAPRRDSVGKEPLRQGDVYAKRLFNDRLVQLTHDLLRGFSPDERGAQGGR